MPWEEHKTQLKNKGSADSLNQLSLGTDDKANWKGRFAPKKILTFVLMCEISEPQLAGHLHPLPVELVGEARDTAQV